MKRKKEKSLKILMEVAKVGNDIDTWTEEIDTERTRCLKSCLGFDFTATQYADRVIQYFNDTLRPGETRRRLISAQEIK